MKRFILQLLVISGFFCLLNSCEKESNAVPDKYEFEGEWSWVETISGWGDPMNPDNFGHTISLSIDHTTYTLFLDDAANDPLSYEFKTDTNHFGTLVEYIKLEDGKRYNVYVDSINLILSDNLLDGSSWHYIKK